MSLKDSGYALAIHTSSPDLGLAISNFAEDSRQQVWNLGRDLSSHLHAYLAEFLKPQTWKDLAFLAVAIGPGGFTGTRIGVVAARILAQQLNIPLFGISSLAAIAHHQAIQGHVAVQMPAQRGELYTAIYEVLAEGLQPQLLDSVMSPDAWQQTLTQWQAPYSTVTAESAQGKFVADILELAYQQWQTGQHPHWSEVLPFYGQHPVENHA